MGAPSSTASAVPVPVLVLRELGLGDGWLRLRLQGAVQRCASRDNAAPHTHHTQEREDGLTEWDRFARAEYLRLAMEEDADNDTASDGAWSRLDAL